MVWSKGKGKHEAGHVGLGCSHSAVPLMPLIPYAARIAATWSHAHPFRKAIS